MSWWLPEQDDLMGGVIDLNDGCIGGGSDDL